jgi:hypothetical protein
MKHTDKVKAIQFICPNAQFVLIDDEIDWRDETQAQPTDKEIQAALKACQLVEAAEIKSNATAKSALLTKLGITEDEAKLLLS